MPWQLASDHLTSILDGFGNHLDSILDACQSHLESILDAVAAGVHMRLSLTTSEVPESRVVGTSSPLRSDQQQWRGHFSWSTLATFLLGS